MSAWIINSDNSLQSFIGDIREEWNSAKYLRVTIKRGKDRSIPQNSISHAWYEQLARELREDDAIGWKCHAKLHYGVPILRAEDEEFRTTYDLVIKRLTYEQKLEAMKCWPVSSLMTKVQLGKYLEAMQQGFAQQGVYLTFPEQCA